MTGKKETDSRAIMDAVRRMVQVLRVSSRAAESHLGVSGAQLFVLRALEASTPRGLSITELAARTRTHQSSVSVVVSRLVAAKLVARAPAERDARVCEIRLTAEGARVLKLSPVTPQELLVESIGRLAATERAELRRLLELVITGAEFEGGPAPMFFEEAQ